MGHFNPKQAGIFEAKSTHFGLWQLQPHFSSKSQKQDFKWKLVSLCICRAFDHCPMLYGLAVRWQRSSLVLSLWADSAPPPACLGLRSWIIIDFFSRKLVWFGMIWVSVSKIDLWGIFPTQFLSLSWDLWSIMRFSQNHRILNYLML